MPPKVGASSLAMPLTVGTTPSMVSTSREAIMIVSNAAAKDGINEWAAF
jgi:hypothetical protein